MAYLTQHLLIIFGLWLLWSAAEVFVTMPKWAWYLIAVAAGMGAEVLIGEADDWFLGIGTAGAAAFLMLVTDLLLVATDSTRVSVLRQARNR